MNGSRTLARGGAATLALAALVLAGCSSSASHHSAAAPMPASPAAPGTQPPASAPPTAAATPAVGERTTRLGEVLTTADGRTLYTFALDKAGMSACTGSCATNWPPLTIGPGDAAASSVHLPQLLGTITRPGGGVQVTFGGQPLYRFAGDTAAGQVNGQGIKGVWHAVTLPAAANGGPSTMPPAPRTSPTAPAARTSSTTNCIPQGGAGDGDGDNSGGDSDGDGCT
jgi:predicted lipoprotein with Yx(FWY)xxD motif